MIINLKIIEIMKKIISNEEYCKKKIINTFQEVLCFYSHLRESINIKYILIYKKLKRILYLKHIFNEDKFNKNCN